MHPPVGEHQREQNLGTPPPHSQSRRASEEIASAHQPSTADPRQSSGHGPCGVVVGGLLVQRLKDRPLERTGELADIDKPVRDDGLAQTA
jgi:hypothetical protein